MESRSFLLLSLPLLGNGAVVTHETVHESIRTKVVDANKSNGEKGGFPYSANKLNGFDCGPSTCDFAVSGGSAIMDTHGELGIWPG